MAITGALRADPLMLAQTDSAAYLFGKPAALALGERHSLQGTTPPARLLKFGPLLLLTALGLIFFLELLLHPTQTLYSEQSDLLALHLPMKRFVARSWQQTGELPLWCPYSFGGMPLVHDIQVAAFYPPHLALYVLPEEWLGAALSWLVVLHVLIAGWGMYAYARSQALGPTASLVAGIGFMFAGKWLLHVLAGGHYIFIPLAWLPLVLLCQETALQRRSLVWATWAGGVFGLIVLGAHPQVTLYAGVFVSLWTLGTYTAGIAGLGRWFGLGAWAALVAVSLGAIELLPALEAAPHASRAGGVAAREITATVLPLLLSLFGPGWFPTWEQRGGLGLLWAAVALMALVLRSRQARRPALASLVVLFYALGGAALFQGLPGFHLFQLPVRALLLLAFPVALLAGITTDALVAGPAVALDLRRRCARLLSVVLVAGPVLALGSVLAHCASWHRKEAIRLGLPPAEWSVATVQAWVEGQVHGRLQVYWLVLLGAAAVMLWQLGRRCRLSSGARRAVWVGLLVADAWALTWPHVAVRPDAQIYAPPPATRYLAPVRQERPDEHWRVLDRGLSLCQHEAALGFAQPLLGGVEVEPVHGFNSLDVCRFKEYLQFAADEDRPLRTNGGTFGYAILPQFPVRNPVLLDLLGTRYVVQPRDTEGRRLDPWDPEDSGWRPVSDESFPQTDGPSYALFENPCAFPRAFVVERARPLAEGSEVLSQLKATDFRRVVLLEGYMPVAYSSASEAARALRPARMKSYTPNQVVVETNGDADGYLVLTDVWFPGWTCTVDATPAEVYRANYLFRATPVPAGRHEVVFTFAPVSYERGRWLSVAALVGVLGVSLCGRPRAPRPDPAN
jgi:hypothetical protein